MMHILLDGWSLVYAAQSPTALHLMTLMAACPADVNYTVALPGSRPDWLAQDVQLAVKPTPNSEWGRFLWEQRWLHAIASSRSADLLHLTTPTPPLSISMPVVLSPSGQPIKKPYASVISRLRAACAAGGMSRLSAVFWPGDLPLPGGNLPLVRLPVVVHPGFYDEEHGSDALPGGVLLPETYVLFPQIEEGLDLDRLADIWSWVHGSVGDYYPLLLAGLSNRQRREVEEWFSRNGMQDWVQVLPPVNPLAAPYLYARSTLVFHMGSLPAWGNSARNALASAKPFVATLSSEMDAIVGPAAYLVPAGDERSLGAALVSVIVEESLSEQLSQAARERASAWELGKFSAALRQAYSDILSG